MFMYDYQAIKFHGSIKYYDSHVKQPRNPDQLSGKTADLDRIYSVFKRVSIDLMSYCFQKNPWFSTFRAQVPCELSVLWDK